MNPYYKFVTKAVPGTTIRSQLYNSEQESVETAFEKAKVDIDLRLAFPADFTGNPVLPSTLNSHAVVIDADGNAGYHPIEDIDSAQYYAGRSEFWAGVSKGYAENLSHPVTLAVDGHMTADVPNYIVKHSGNIFFPPITGAEENQQFRVTASLGFVPSINVDNDVSEVIKTSKGEFTIMILDVEIEYVFTLINGKWEF